MIFHNLLLTFTSNHPSASFQIGICFFCLETTNESFVFILKAVGDISQFSVDDSEHVCLQLHQRGEHECSGEE